MTKTLTLLDAVSAEVSAFCRANEPFSVHQITTNIRNKVNSGEYNIPNVMVIGMPYKYAIEHSEVKILFRYLLDDNWLPELDVKYNGLYAEYTPVPPKRAVLARKVSTDSNTKSLLVDNGEVLRRVKTYLESKANSVVRPTVKQVQSAIKRGNRAPGLACRNIIDYIEQLGYKLRAIGRPSTWIVE